jgi:hypothetical protein
MSQLVSKVSRIIINNTTALVSCFAYAICSGLVLLFKCISTLFRRLASVRGSVIAFLFGLVLSATSIAALDYAFRPHLLNSEAVLPKSVNLLAEDCDQSSEIPIYFHVKTPHLLQNEASGVLRIENISKCKSLFIRVKKPVSGVFLSSSEPFTAKDAESAARVSEALRRKEIVPVRKGDLFDNYEVVTADFDDYWSVEIEGVFVGNRISFDSYHFEGAIALPAGNWKMDIVPDSRYERISGDPSFQVRAEKGTRKTLSFSLKFVELDSLREVFAIIISTILGVGLSTVVEGIAAMPRRKK